MIADDFFGAGCVLGEPNAYHANVDLGEVQGDMRINFKYQCFGADGFYIYRGESEDDLEVIDTIYDNTFSEMEQKEYLDQTGTPGTTYYYGVEAYSDRDNEK